MALPPPDPPAPKRKPRKRPGMGATSEPHVTPGTSLNSQGRTELPYGPDAKPKKKPRRRREDFWNPYSSPAGTVSL